MKFDLEETVDKIFDVWLKVFMPITGLILTSMVFVILIWILIYFVNLVRISL